MFMKTDFNFIEYLQSRKISEEVITKFNLRFENDKIVIPINGVFNKYRKHPHDTSDKPKYIYDKGSEVTLFNLEAIKDSEEVFVTEGELDALVLESHGLTAVSSTGGSQSFKPEWAELFLDKNVIIAFDNDIAGAEGVLKILKLLPQAKVVWLEGKKFKGKDVTDFFQFYNDSALRNFRSLITETYQPDFAKPDIDNAEYFKKMRRELNNQDRNSLLADTLRQYFLNQSQKFKKVKPKKTDFGNEIDNAKSVPVSNFIQFNSSNKARCIWHKEKTPSLVWYPDDNHLYCFGGCGYRDVINVVMKQNPDFSFKDALNYLNKYTN